MVVLLYRQGLRPRMLQRDFKLPIFTHRPQRLTAFVSRKGRLEEKKQMFWFNAIGCFTIPPGPPAAHAAKGLQVAYFHAKAAKVYAQRPQRVCFRQWA